MPGAKHAGYFVKPVLVGNVVGGGTQRGLETIAVKVTQASEGTRLWGEPPAIQLLVNQTQRTALRHRCNHRLGDEAGRLHNERFGEQGSQLFSGHAAVETMNRSDAELAFDQLGDVRHRGACSTSQRRVTSLITKRAGNCVTVMAICDQHRRRRDKRRNRSHPRWVVDSFDAVCHAIVVTKLTEQFTAGDERITELFAQRQPPHRREIRRGGACEVEPISLRFGCGSLMRQDCRRTFVDHFECSDYTNSVALRTAGVDEAHAIQRERWSRVVNQNSGGTPFGQRRCGDEIGVVGISRVVADRQVDGDDVVRVEVCETTTVIGAQHVIRRSRDACKISSRRVAQCSKRQEGRTRGSRLHTSRMAGRCHSMRELASVLP